MRFFGGSRKDKSPPGDVKKDKRASEVVADEVSDSSNINGFYETGLLI